MLAIVTTKLLPEQAVKRTYIAIKYTTPKGENGFAGNKNRMKTTLTESRRLKKREEGKWTTKGVCKEFLLTFPIKYSRPRKSIDCIRHSIIAHVMYATMSFKGNISHWKNSIQALKLLVQDQLLQNPRQLGKSPKTSIEPASITT
ncbi:hypothetical protein L6164_014493 [Bauhinia variegata]|uniref:Uncharacterized protein n=1 Tax=Bauhinia variegata TaxID=167791 RepID=A0ACB9NL63_BAUVA|nr:hypothetical protein L6164_014493 [Bauhinia variegata]